MTNNLMLQISLAILLLPLLSFLIIIFNQKRFGKAAGVIGTSILGIDLILAGIVAYSKLVTFGNEGMIQWKYNWIHLGSKEIVIGIGVDNLTAIMLIIVTLISMLVHLFSTEYMSEDKRFPRFYAYLGIFTFSMLGIVIANNFLNMYIFWELVGLSSYLLIGFWYEKDSAANASKKAFIANRIGDLGFFSGIMIAFFTFKTFMFDEIFNQISMGVIPYDSGAMLTLMGILIFAGAIGKSAQFPLHVWLPDAMEGPTPVSALIHAATMVAAGVYMTARVYPLFSGSALTFIAYIGAITAFIAATIALTQTDFKKVLAYSTVSQLGFMVMALGVGAYSYGFFHLMTHAWFKACLFLASGSVIHAMHHAMHHLHDHHSDPQDIRNMGGLRKTMPITYYSFLLATIAIAGVPFTSGFLSKDGILAGTLAFGNLSGHWLIPIFGFVSAGMTAFYMFRLAIISFHGKPSTEIAAKTHENKFVIVFPLILLAGISVWFFYSPNPFNAGAGWYAEKIKTPASVVPAQYQWDFITPTAVLEENKLKAEHIISAKHNVAEASALNEKNDSVIVAATMHTPTDSTNVISAHNQTEAIIGNTEHKTTESVATTTEHNPVQASGHGGGHAALNKFETEMHHQHYNAMYLSLLIAGFGILLSFVFYQFKKINADKVANAIRPLYLFSLNKWYFDELYDFAVIGATIGLSKVFYWIDSVIFDGIVNGTAVVVRFASFIVGKFDNIVVDGLVNLSGGLMGFFGLVLRKFQTGRVQTYLALSLIGLIVFIWWVL